MVVILVGDTLRLVLLDRRTAGFLILHTTEAQLTVLSCL